MSAQVTDLPIATVSVPPLLVYECRWFEIWNPLEQAIGGDAVEIQLGKDQMFWVNN